MIYDIKTGRYIGREKRRHGDESVTDFRIAQPDDTSYKETKKKTFGCSGQRFVVALNALISIKELLV